MKKKVFLLLASSFLVMSLGACGSRKKSSKSSSAITSSSADTSSSSGSSSKSSDTSSSGGSSSSEGGSSSSSSSSSEGGGTQEAIYSYSLGGSAAVEITVTPRTDPDGVTETWLEQYELSFASVTAGDKLLFYKGSEQLFPGASYNDLKNNVVQSDTDYELSVVSSAENVTCYFKVYAEGYDVWMTGRSGGGEGGGGEETSNWYIKGSWDEWVEPIEMSELDSEDANVKAQYAIEDMHMDAATEFKVTDNADIWLGYEIAEPHVSIARGEGSDGKYNIKTTYSGTFDIYFKIYQDDSLGIAVIGESDEPGLEFVTIYFRDASWWNKDAASTNYLAWSGDTQPAGIGSMMTHLEWVPASGYNYWSCSVRNDATSIVFFRTGESGSADWGARTVVVDLTARGDNDMYDISATSAAWYDQGHSVTGVWATYSA